MSLTAGVRRTLRKFEILLENKHMNTNDIQQASTPDADICGELRTLSGQEITGTIRTAIAFRSRDEAIERLCLAVFGANPVYPDPVPTPPAPAAVEEFKRELDAKLAATTDEQLRAELEAVGCDFTTPPADRPTPITDAEERNYPQPEYLQLIQFEGCTMGVIDPDGYAELYEKCRDLERHDDRWTIEAFKAAVNTLVRENERLRDARAKAEKGECLLELTIGMMEQDIATIREIITKGGTAADILKFLDTPNA